MTEEGEIQREIVSALRKIGVWVDRRNSGGRLGRVRLCETGTPDLWTQLGYLEVKVPGKGLSDDQRAWHAKAKLYGVRVATVYSAGEAVDVVRQWQAESCKACGR